MKTYKSKIESKAKPKDGFLGEYFKDGTISSIGKYIKGKKQACGNTIYAMDR